jgi:hypothetical protein
MVLISRIRSLKRKISDRNSCPTQVLPQRRRDAEKRFLRGKAKLGHDFGNSKNRELTAKMECNLLGFWAFFIFPLRLRVSAG